jgi:hypothetical protein
MLELITKIGNGRVEVDDEETESFLGGGSSDSEAIKQRQNSRSKRFNSLICALLLLVVLPIYFLLPSTSSDQQVTQVDKYSLHTNFPDPVDVDLNDGVLSNFPEHKKVQIQNYLDGKSLMIDFHITHHAGTSLCQWARANGPTESFACMGGENVPTDLKKATSGAYSPWLYNETDDWINKVRPVFHYISWEYDVHQLKRSVNDTNWEHPRLVSIIVMRNPLDRLLSDVGSHNVKNGTAEEWWQYAGEIGTNNYALRTIMSKEGCCQGSDTSEDYVELAKSYLNRFTFIIDMDCFDQSVEVLSSIMNLTHDKTPARKPAHKSARERINNDTLYEYLIHRNAKDIGLYKWARSQSLVKCQEKTPL